MQQQKQRIRNGSTGQRRVAPICHLCLVLVHTPVKDTDNQHLPLTLGISACYSKSPLVGDLIIERTHNHNPRKEGNSDSWVRLD